MDSFVRRREEVIDYIKQNMVEQGATRAEAITATTCVLFWSSKDVDNLYRCINSDLPKETIKAIVAHDFNGLSRGDVGFLPKSTQFSRVPEMELKVPYIKPKSLKAEREVA
jgi:hypothetical protein